MFARLSKCGGIKDLELGLNWDSQVLAEEVARRAAALALRSIGRGSVVAITHGGTARFFADLLATWSVGATAACLDTTLTQGELRTVVDFADANILLVDGEMSTISDPSVPIVDLNRELPACGASAVAAINADDPALLLFTSGTTGKPKGVVLTFGAVSARIDANIAAIGADTLSRTLVTLPTYFGHGLIGNSLTALLSGGDIVLHPRGMPLINSLGPIVDEHRISFMSSVPSLWRLALTCSRKPVGRSLLRVHIGSAPLSAALWSEVAEWSGAEVVNCYGITETANWIAGASSRKEGIVEGLVGPMWGGTAAIMDEHGSICDQGAGEIIIQSPCLTSGYLKRPDLTAAAFSRGWFRTGDQGSIDAQGRILVTGRIKDEINRGGFKVQPAEIDSLLEGHPAVAEACVFGIPDPMGGEAVAAAIRLADGESTTPLSLQAWCSERLRRAAVPEHWFFVSEIPRTARGKVSRDIVRRTLTQDTDARTLAATPEKPAGETIAIAIPATDTEQELLRLWKEVLGIDALGVEDDFFALGGTSLMAARLFAEISRRFTVKLPLSAILESPTVRALSRQLRQEQHSPTGPLVELKHGAPRNLFIVHDGIGETLLYLNLARRMPPDVGVMGIEPRRLPGVPLAHTRVEDMASFYMAEVRKKQPHGPYLLAGMCAGGVIAYEMASQLTRAGESVGLLALLDAVTPQAPKRTGLVIDARHTRTQSMLKDIKSAAVARAGRTSATVRAICGPLVHAGSWRISQYAGNLSLLARFRLLRLLLSHNLPWPTFLPELNFQQILYSAQKLYVPRPLAVAPVVLARATAGDAADMPYSEIYAENTLGWSAVAQNLAIVDVDGGHESMLREPFVASLANALMPYLERSPARTDYRVGEPVEA
jgi:acyl-CoA synthetase (AMP-forming)/AMP-acid ligase II/thioesterase domain-containing protein/acyl carrier protein